MKDLTKVRGGLIQAPKKIVLYGPEGAGKSTWASHAPSPIFMGAEAGTEHLDVRRIPMDELRHWGDALEWLESLARGGHNYKTLVVDSLDWLEGWVWKYIAMKGQKDSIEDFGYAGGYKKAVEEWRREFLPRIDFLRDRVGMHIVLIAHSKISRFSDPAGEEWDRYSLALDDKPGHDAAGVFKQWANELYFVTFDQRARKKNKWDSKGVGSDKRLIYTTRGAAYDAKTRDGFNPKLPLDGKGYWAHVGDPAYKGPEMADVEEDGEEEEGAERRHPDPTSGGREVSSKTTQTVSARATGTERKAPPKAKEEPPFKESDFVSDERVDLRRSLKLEIKGFASQLTSEKTIGMAVDYLMRAGDDVEKLSKLARWVEQRVAEQRAREDEPEDSEQAPEPEVEIKPAEPVGAGSGGRRGFAPPQG